MKLPGKIFRNKVGNITKPNNMPTSDAKPVFLKKHNLTRGFDIFDIENYTVGIPFIIDQRSLLHPNHKNLQLSVSIVDQKYLIRNELEPLNNGFSRQLITSILSINVDSIKNIESRNLVIDLQNYNQQIKDYVLQNKLDDNAYENYVITEFEKIYFLNKSEFENLFTQINSERYFISRTVSLSSLLSISNNIPNTTITSINKAIKSLTDEQLFERCYKFELTQIQPNTNIAKNTTNTFVSYEKPSKFDKLNLDEKLNGHEEDASRLIRKLYKLNVDPSQLFKGEDTQSSLYNQIVGATINKSAESLDDMHTLKEIHYNNSDAARLLDVVFNSKSKLTRQNNHIIDNLTSDSGLGSSSKRMLDRDLEDLTRLRKQNVNYVQTISKRSNRFKKFFVYFDLKDNMIRRDSPDKLYIQMNSSKKIVGAESFKYSIFNRFKKYLFESFDINDISITHKKSDNGKYFIHVLNNSNYNVIINFETIRDLDRIKRIHSKKSNKLSVISKTDTLYEIGDVNLYSDVTNLMVRYTVDVDILGEQFSIDNINSIKIVDDNPVYRQPRHAAVFAYQDNLANIEERQQNSFNKNTPVQGVNVLLHCEDDQYLGVKFLKRDTTFGSEGEFLPLKDDNEDRTVLSENNEYEFREQKEILDVDYFKPGCTYEYVAEIMTLSGYTYMSAPFKVKISNDPDNFVMCGMNQSNFNIKKISQETSFIQEIFDLIKQDKEEGLYNDDLKAINQATKEILFAEIEVLTYDKQFSCFFYRSMGDHNDGDSFSPTLGSSIFGKKFYKITPYQSSPILVINLVNDLISKIDNDTSDRADAVEKSILLSKLRPKIDEIRNENRVNLLTREFLKEGIIPATDRETNLTEALSNIKKNTKLNDDTVVYIDYAVNTENSLSNNTNIKIKKCKYTKFSDGRIYVNFDMLTRRLSLNNIDFLIVCAEKNNIMTPITTVSARKIKNISFIDNASVSFAGEIKYFVKPVLKNGNILNPIFLKTVVINDNGKL
jgi:hypothetical protein